MDLRVSRESDLPLGVQLAGRLREQIEAGGLAPGDRLPSLREVAQAAGVNVNTVRAVYARLERDGLVTTEQGRGSFVKPRGTHRDAGAEAAAAARRQLRAQIAALESELARRPPPPSEARPRQRTPSGAALLSTEELAGVRDDLFARLRELDVARAEVLQRLRELPDAERGSAGRSGGRSSLSLSGARVRWSSA